MNERWVELCEEAEKYALSKVNSAGYCFETNMYIDRLSKMKLAELIIQECIRLGEESQYKCRTFPVSVAIKEHFGVK